MGGGGMVNKTEFFVPENLNSQKYFTKSNISFGSFCVVLHILDAKIVMFAFLTTNLC